MTTCSRRFCVFCSLEMFFEWRHITRNLHSQVESRQAHKLQLWPCLLLSRYLVIALNSFSKIDREYSLAPNDYWIRFLSSKVSITAGCRCGDSIHIDAVALKFIFYLIMSVFVYQCCDTVCWTVGGASLVVSKDSLMGTIPTNSNSRMEG